LTGQDESALQLGKQVMSSVFNQPEVTSPDSMSRFFLDSWLAKNGSHSKTADTLSVDLMCGLQRAIGQHKFTSLDLNRDENLDLDSSAEVLEVDEFSYPTSVAQTTATAIGLEALDRMIEVFGPSNPALKDIRDALLPSIYVSLAKPPTVTEDVLAEHTDMPTTMFSTEQPTTEAFSLESRCFHSLHLQVKAQKMSTATSTYYQESRTCTASLGETTSRKFFVA
jgi:hypothetical protein